VDGSSSFKERFRKLYDLYLEKDVTVAELHSLGWADGGRDGCGDEDC